MRRRQRLERLLAHWQRRAVRAEEDADELYLHLRALCHQLHEKRYDIDGPCPGCYDATYEHEAALAWRTTNE